MRNCGVFPTMSGMFGRLRRNFRRVREISSREPPIGGSLGARALAGCRHVAARQLAAFGWMGPIARNAVDEGGTAKFADAVVHVPFSANYGRKPYGSGEGSMDNFPADQR